MKLSSMTDGLQAFLSLGRARKDWTVIVRLVNLGSVMIGCFGGDFVRFEKGSKLFWEESSGTIDSELSCEKIVPKIADEVRRRPGILLMQDNAPPHSSRRMATELRTRGIPTIGWPPCSPDLNSIESLGNQMEYFIQDKYPDLGEGRQRSSREIKRLLKKHGESVSYKDPINLLLTMPARCRAVLNADGGPTQY